MRHTVFCIMYSIHNMFSCLLQYAFLINTGRALYAFIAFFLLMFVFSSDSQLFFVSPRYAVTPPPTWLHRTQCRISTVYTLWHLLAEHRVVSRIHRLHDRSIHPWGTKLPRACFHGTWCPQGTKYCVQGGVTTYGSTSDNSVIQSLLIDTTRSFFVVEFNCHQTVNNVN